VKRIVYVKVIMSKRTGCAPSLHGFYSNPYSEARIRGYFGDSVTLFFERATEHPELVVGEIMEEMEGFQYGNCVDLRMLTRSEFLQSVREREAANA
jgi:hypothetical protein